MRKLLTLKAQEGRCEARSMEPLDARQREGNDSLMQWTSSDSGQHSETHARLLTYNGTITSLCYFKPLKNNLKASCGTLLYLPNNPFTSHSP